MSVINTNIKSLVAQNSLSINARSMSSAMERLSTGNRINSAKDDAAGLAISTRMNADLRGMSVAIRNANDGISMMQTAEGAMGEVSNMLQRMRDLSVQAASATMTDDNRLSLQAEFTQLVAEIDNVSKTTNFNGIKLLDGSAKNVGIQTGVGEGDQVALKIAAADSKTLGLRGFQVEGQMTTGRVGAVGSLAVDDVQINGYAAMATATTATTNLAKELATAINTNSGNHRVVAEAFNTLKGTVPTANIFAAAAITVNGDAVGAANSVEELVSNINRDVAGVTAVLSDDGAIELSNNTGNEIIILGGSTAGFTAGTYQGFVTLSHLDGDAISVKAKNLENGHIGGAGTLADVAAFGLNETADGSIATGKAVTQTAISASDDLKINGFRVGASSDGSAASKVTAINAISESTGVTASASTTAVLTVDMSGTKASAMTGAAAATTFSINGTTIALGATTTSLSALVTAINTAQIPDVKASSDDDGRLILTSDTGATISVKDGSATFVTEMASSSGEAKTGLLGATVGAATAGWSISGRISLSSESGADIRVESSTAAVGNLIGFAEQGGKSTLVGGALSITSQAGAGRAITQIDSALDTVSMNRSNLGAFQNRLTAAVDNLSDQSRHLSESKSRIMDTDYAVETTNLARAQVIQQAATAMLAQANQQPSGVLALLQ